MSDLEAFLAGKAPDYVAIVLDETVVEDPAVLSEYGESIPGGWALVLGGATGRSVFEQLTGEAPMAFARTAGDRDGTVERDLSDGTCPTTDGDDPEHRPRIILSFVEAQNPEVGGLYAEGPVVHAYVACTCGTAYADRWVVET